MAPYHIIIQPNVHFSILQLPKLSLMVHLNLTFQAKMILLTSEFFFSLSFWYSLPAGIQLYKTPLSYQNE